MARLMRANKLQPVHGANDMNATREEITRLAEEYRQKRRRFTPAKLLLDNGRDFAPSPLPSGMRLGKPKQCYLNSLPSYGKPGPLAMSTSNATLPVRSQRRRMHGVTTAGRASLWTPRRKDAFAYRGTATRDEVCL